MSLDVEPAAWRRALVPGWCRAEWCQADWLQWELVQASAAACSAAGCSAACHGKPNLLRLPRPPPPQHGQAAQEGAAAAAGAEGQVASSGGTAGAGANECDALGLGSNGSRLKSGGCAATCRSLCWAWAVEPGLCCMLPPFCGPCAPHLQLRHIHCKLAGGGHWRGGWPRDAVQPVQTQGQGGRQPGS